MEKTSLKRISIIDFLNFTYLVILLILTFLSASNNNYFYQTTCLYILLLSSLIFLIGIRHRIKNTRTYRLVFLIYPIIYVFAIFESIALILPALNPNTYDHILMKIDLSLLKLHPTVWIERFFHPWLTELMYIFYIYYFIMPLTLVIWLYYHREFDKLEKVYFVTGFSYYASYLCYILVPASGPRFNLNHLQTKPLQGIYLADILRDLINMLEPNKMDAFPSVHGLITLVVLILTYKYYRKLFYLSLPMSAGITISLIYCRYHYLVDVLAGFILAIIFVIIAFWILERTQGIFHKHFEQQNQHFR